MLEKREAERALRGTEDVRIVGINPCSEVTEKYMEAAAFDASRVQRAAFVPVFGNSGISGEDLDKFKKEFEDFLTKGEPPQATPVISEPDDMCSTPIWAVRSGYSIDGVVADFEGRFSKPELEVATVDAAVMEAQFWMLRNLEAADYMITPRYEFKGIDALVNCGDPIELDSICSHEPDLAGLSYMDDVLDDICEENREEARKLKDY